MKWVMLAVAAILLLDFWFLDDAVAAVFAAVFLFAAFTLRKDDDAL